MLLARLVLLLLSPVRKLPLVARLVLVLAGLVLARLILARLILARLISVALLLFLFSLFLVVHLYDYLQKLETAREMPLR